MSTTLCIATCKTDSGAYPAYDSKTALVGSSIGFESLNTGSHFDCGTLVVRTLVVQKVDGLQMMSPHGQST